mmetsp:Transcript_41902/g.115521  ORF Transcript_41902/g.115521 Transcript_41902/m.115521 type:complete len:143 (+) Transcript_41902:280-708(+)
MIHRLEHPVQLACVGTKSSKLRPVLRWQHWTKQNIAPNKCLLPVATVASTWHRAVGFLSGMLATLLYYILTHMLTSILLLTPRVAISMECASGPCSETHLLGSSPAGLWSLQHFYLQDFANSILLKTTWCAVSAFPSSRQQR